MKKILFTLLYVFAMTASFAQQENKLLNFYKTYYDLNFSNENAEEVEKFMTLYKSNSFELDFKKAIYAVFINNQIANDRDVSYKAFILLQLMKFDNTLETPLYKQKGTELHNNLNLVCDNAIEEIAKLHIYEEKKPKLKDKILFSKEEYEEAKTFISKYLIKKVYSK